MKKKMSKITLIAVISLVSLVSVIPFYVMIIMSTHTTEDIFKGLIILPGNELWTNLQSVFNQDFFRYYFNSTYISITSTVLSVLSSSLIGFALAKYKFRYQKFIYAFVLATMMIPWQISMVGYVIQLKYMGLIDSHIPLIFPWAANAFGAFWMTQYIKKGVSNEIIESARIDGCNELFVFFRIVFPMLRPATASLAMVIFLWSWNNYFMPAILLTNTKLYTIPLCIASLGNFYRVDYGARMAGLFLSIFPLIIIFIIGSKTFIRGLTAGSVKG